MDAIVTMDESWRILIFNSAAERVFGYSAAEVTHKSLEMLIPGRLWDAYQHEIEHFSGGNLTHSSLAGSGLVFGLKADGHEIALTAAMTKCRSGKHQYLTLVFRDITERRRIEEDLRASTRLMEAIVESSDDAIIGKSLQGIILTWNAGAERLFGYTAAEAIGNSMLMLIPPERAHEEPDILSRIARGERVSHFETVRLRKDRSRVDVSVTLSPLYDEQGQVIGASKIARNITESRRARERVARLARMHAVLSSINSLIVRSHDREELLQEACEIASSQGEFDGAWVGLADPGTARVLFAAAAGREFRSHLAELERDASGFPLGSQAQEAMQGRCPVISRPPGSADAAGWRSLIALPLMIEEHAAGVIELFGSRSRTIDAEELRLLTEVTRDIAFALAHIAQEERLQYLAYHDALTGLANRTLFHERLSHVIRNARQADGRVAVMIGDIKGFRQINEEMGRLAGDNVLREYATRLRQMSPEPQYLARISADYFAGIVSGFESVAEVAHRIEQGLENLTDIPFHVGRLSLHISPRLGIAVMPEDGIDADTLFKHAEAAHRHCRAAGERYLFYRDDVNTAVAETLLLESKLKRAFEHKEFYLVFQPIVRAADGALCAMEALLRWRDPELGDLGPAQFVPILESSGMIVEVGAWVIKQALAQRNIWRAQGLVPPRIAVNVSAIQMRRKNFLDLVKGLLAGEDPEALELEITETTLMNDYQDNVAVIQQLRALGLGVAIDDFGTGYSSLAYLARLPVSTIKIDRTFVSQMTTDANSMSIVSAVLSLAQALKLKVIAEGVETDEQARFLNLLRCDQLQGYLFGRPMPAEELAKRLPRLQTGPVA